MSEIEENKLTMKSGDIFTTEQEISENKVLKSYSDYIDSLHKQISTLEKKVKKYYANSENMSKLLIESRELNEELEEKVKELEHSLFELRGKYDARAKELYETEQKVKKLEIVLRLAMLGRRKLKTSLKGKSVW